MNVTPIWPLLTSFWFISVSGARGDDGVAHQAAELPGTLAKG